MLETAQQRYTTIPMVYSQEAGGKAFGTYSLGHNGDELGWRSFTFPILHFLSFKVFVEKNHL